MAARIIRPISSLEFAHMMQKAIPPAGWLETIGKIPFRHPGLKLTLTFWLKPLQILVDPIRFA